MVETERARLRRIRATDGENMRLLEADAEVMRFTPSRVPLTREQTERRLLSIVEKEPAYAPLGVWAVELKDSGEFAGWLMLLQTEFEFPELGFMMVRRFWGQGLATEVARGLMEFGFDQLGLKGITAAADSDNAASIRILEKLGFSPLKTIAKFDKVRAVEGELRVFKRLRN